jgi:hypothetical protein
VKVRKQDLGRRAWELFAGTGDTGGIGEVGRVVTARAELITRNSTAPPAGATAPLPRIAEV